MEDYLQTNLGSNVPSLKIDSKLSAKASVVDVLLATLNGDQFLQQFLDSLSNQKNVEINLLVSDDGSSDETLNILESNRYKFRRLEIFNGPKKGPCENFFFLLSKSKAKFIAFADQDDIWLDSHLANAVTILKSTDKPSLYFTSSETFGEVKRGEVWPRGVEITLQKSIFANFARGCTMVFDNKLRDLVLQELPLHAIMHDWWVYLVALTCGNVYFNSNAEIFYRIHTNNYIGLGNKSLIFRLTQLIGRTFPSIAQLTDLIDIHERNMDIDCYRQIMKVLKSLDASFNERLKWAMFSKNRLRTNLFDEIRLRIALLLFAG
jgi:glycosyltransferase involved in cell wall biosynthesis